MTTEELYSRIFSNNKKWVESKLQLDQDYFKKMAEGQQPPVLYIGCSDSRVPANEIMGLDAGEVFVHRNVANLVVNTDLNAQSVIQYAVDSLHVQHIVVCGHYECGGVAAAMKSQDLGQLNNWLREVRDVYRLHEKELNAISDLEQRYRRLVELNVHEQCVNVIKTSFVQKQFALNGYPVVHGWVFELATGYIKDLNIDFEGILRHIQEIYKIV